MQIQTSLPETNKLQRQKSRQRTRNLFKKLIKQFSPPPDMTISEWADKYRRLSGESSSEPGRWRTSRAEYQREIMDAVSDPRTITVILKTSAQVGKTEILCNIIGYYIDYDPAPILYVMPTDDLAQTFSEDRLAPMIRDCPTIRVKVKEAKSRDSGNTIMRKRFPGGQITMIGANTPKKLSSRPIRILLLDEIDRFPVSAGKEGDPMNLAVKRTNNFWNKKIVAVSTPTIKGASKIDTEYESSSQEVLHIQCPCCGEFVPYEWENLKFKHEKGTRNFEILGYMCPSCGGIEIETEWKKQRVKWIAKYPERIEKRGFHLNELASPWRTWDEIVADFLQAKHDGIEAEKVWHNTSLGLSWEEQGELDMNDLLLKRRQFYNCEVPQEAVVLTAGVDVQDNRLEYEILAWGVDKVSWGIYYGVLMGDPGQETVWEQLSDVLFRNYKRADGLEMQVMTTCIDSGGHHTTEVYAYCKKHEAKRVWAIKGQGGSGVPFVKRPKKRNDSGAWLFMIGVDVGKDTITSRLSVGFENKPGFCHFPMEQDRGYDEQYFMGLTAEKRKIRSVNGKILINWVLRTDGARNEPFDIRNYATAALEILNPQLEKLYERLKDGKPAPKQQQTQLRNRQKRTKKGIDIY